MTTDRVDPNPPSPYATAAPDTRHIFPSIFGSTPMPGILTYTACAHLAVVPDEPRHATDPGDLPPGMCTLCVLVMHGAPPLRNDTPHTTCERCGSNTRHGRWCASCRQQLHDEHRDRP